MEFKVENLCGFLIRSKLMNPDEVLAMKQRWLAEAKDQAQSTPAFLRWLVASNYTTEYQASLLSRGHVDDFFFGEYRLLERIGRGRMAGVYKAIHPSGQIVAIKVLPPSKAKNSLMLARFHREGRLATKLQHPNVLKSFQLAETSRVHYLVMEYLEGEPLDELIARRKRLPPAEAVRIIHQALLGLQHLHEHNMVHRDLKPANLMIIPAPQRGDSETTLKSNVKVLDIGLAREFFDENTPADAAERDELTGEGVLLGTPDYLAPEQARDPRAIDIRADIYSLGCTLYHFLTGQPPFPDKNILTLIVRHASEVPKPLQEFNQAIPEGLSQIVSWMMAKKPDQRYPTPARAAQALETFLMVTKDSLKPTDETPQMKKYLTWLEMSNRDEDVAMTPKPKSNANVPALKPVSNPIGPVVKPAMETIVPASKQPKPTRPAAQQQPEKQRKRRTGVQMEPAVVPAVPVAITRPANPVAAPAPIAVALPPPAAAAAPIAPAPTALPMDQFDVELVESPEPAFNTRFRLTKREFLIAGIGAGVMLVLFGFLQLFLWIIRWFR